MTPAELRARREALGLSQAELARRLGVAANTWWRWEQGQRQPGNAVALGMALDQLARQPRPRGRPPKRRRAEQPA